MKRISVVLLLALIAVPLDFTNGRSASSACGQELVDPWSHNGTRASNWDWSDANGGCKLGNNGDCPGGPPSV